MGLATHILRIPKMQLILDPNGISSALERRKELLLAILPSGSAIMGVAEMAASFGLCEVQYNIGVDHPVFPDGTTIELDFARIPYIVGEDRISTAYLTIAVRYTGPDGKSLV